MQLVNKPKGVLSASIYYSLHNKQNNELPEKHFSLSQNMERYVLTVSDHQQ